MSHAHHWVLETPNGPTSPGRCKHCGETRMFPNTDRELPDFSPFGKPQERNKPRKRKSARERWGDLALEPRRLGVG